MAMTATEHRNELMSPDQLAERLGVSLRMVREMYYTNTWPHLRLNKRTVRFTEHHYEQILELSEQRPTTLVRKTTSAQKASELAELLSQKRPA
jgi:predicted site-specific integrase-resolvase